MRTDPFGGPGDRSAQRTLQMESDPRNSVSEGSMRQKTEGRTQIPSEPDSTHRFRVERSETFGQADLLDLSSAFCPGFLPGSPLRSGPGSSQKWNDRGGTRTHDQRINLPHRLSPTPDRRLGPLPIRVGVWTLPSPSQVCRVESLGPGPAIRRRPCLLMTQSHALFGPSRLPSPAVVVVSWALRASQHTAASTPAVRFLPARGSIAPERRRSPLLYRLSYPAKGLRTALSWNFETARPEQSPA